MSFSVIHADRATTVLADDPVIPAGEVPTFRDAVALLAEAERLHGAAAATIAAARAAAHAEGRAAGHAEGVAAGETEYRNTLFDLAVRDGERGRARQGEIAMLAIEVVRRIAGEIGEGAVMAGIAERATAAIAPGTAAVVRVTPAAHDAVARRLASCPGIVVEADEGLPPMDCVVETALGRTHAALDTQLAQIERAWARADGGR